MTVACGRKFTRARETSRIVLVGEWVWETGSICGNDVWAEGGNSEDNFFRFSLLPWYKNALIKD